MKAWNLLLLAMMALASTLLPSSARMVGLSAGAAPMAGQGAVPAVDRRVAGEPVAALIARATQLVHARSRVPLAPATAADLRSFDTLEPADSGRVPNYLRALALIPGAAGPYATALKTVIYGGGIEPETKMAMALEIARVLGSPYAVIHSRRMLSASARGRSLLGYFESGATTSPEQDLAIRYAGWLTADVHGVDDDRFRQVRGYYTDPQIVELTLTVSFFNYFTRLVQAANLPLEPWAFEPPAPVTAPARPKPLARVGLITDAELTWARGLTPGRRSSGGLGSGDEYGLVNSQRAMNLVPDVSNAWRAYTGAISRAAEVSQELKLQVSFAVSMANGCRYCTLHQVQGLRALGVSPGKLLEMQKGDAALTQGELTAVTFARTLTRTAATISDQDYAPLRAAFGDRGALEIVLQTCTFAFMNRFTDNLGLPSEDEAVRVYRDVYGKDWK